MVSLSGSVEIGKIFSGVPRKNRNGNCGGAAAGLGGRKVVQTGRDFWSSALAKISTEPWLTTTSGALAGSRGQLPGD